MHLGTETKESKRSNPSKLAMVVKSDEHEALLQRANHAKLNKCTPEQLDAINAQYNLIKSSFIDPDFHIEFLQARGYIYWRFLMEQKACTDWYDAISLFRDCTKNPKSVNQDFAKIFRLVCSKVNSFLSKERIKLLEIVIPYISINDQIKAHAFLYEYYLANSLYRKDAEHHLKLLFEKAEQLPHITNPIESGFYFYDLYPLFKTKEPATNPNPKLALRSCDLALQFADQKQYDFVANIYFQRGFLCLQLNLYHEALGSFYKSLEHVKAYAPKLQSFLDQYYKNGLMLLAQCSLHLRSNPKYLTEFMELCERYFSNGVEYLTDQNPYKQICRSLCAIATGKINLAELNDLPIEQVEIFACDLFEAGQKALAMQIDEWSMSRLANHKELQAKTAVRLGCYFLETGNLDKAIRYFKIASSVAIPIFNTPYLDDLLKNDAIKNDQAKLKVIFDFIFDLHKNHCRDSLCESSSQDSKSTTSTSGLEVKESKRKSTINRDSVNSRCGCGQTLLHILCAQGKTEFLTTFLKADPDPLLEDNFGFRPLDLANINGHSECAKRLHQHITTTQHPLTKIAARVAPIFRSGLERRRRKKFYSLSWTSDRVDFSASTHESKTASFDPEFEKQLTQLTRFIEHAQPFYFCSATYNKIQGAALLSKNAMSRLGIPYKSNLSLEKAYEAHAVFGYLLTNPAKFPTALFPADSERQVYVFDSRAIIEKLEMVVRDEDPGAYHQTGHLESFLLGQVYYAKRIEHLNGVRYKIITTIGPDGNKRQYYSAYGSEVAKGKKVFGLIAQNVVAMLRRVHAAHPESAYKLLEPFNKATDLAEKTPTVTRLCTITNQYEAEVPDQLPFCIAAESSGIELKETKKDQPLETQMLLRQIRTVDTAHYKILFNAIQQGDLNTVREILTQANKEKQTGNLEFPLVTNYCTSHTFDIFATDKDMSAKHSIRSNQSAYEIKPLTHAIRCGQDAIVEYLLTQGADVNAAEGNRFHDNGRSYGYTPLMIAAMLGNLHIVKLLIQHGANIATLRTTSLNPAANDNALSLAWKHGQYHVVEYLLAHGARNIEGFILDDFLLASDLTAIKDPNSLNLLKHTKTNELWLLQTVAREDKDQKPVLSNEDLAKNNLLAVKLYRLAGANIVGHKLIWWEGKLRLARLYEASNELKETKQADYSEIFTYALLDVWLGSSNILQCIGQNKNKLMRIHAQGCLLANPKFGPVPHEMTTLFDENHSPETAKLFANASQKQKLIGLKNLLAISDNDLLNYIHLYGPGDEIQKDQLYRVLQKRREYLAATFKDALTPEQPVCSLGLISSTEVKALKSGGELGDKPFVELKTVTAQPAEICEQLSNDAKLPDDHTLAAVYKHYLNTTLSNPNALPNSSQLFSRSALNALMPHLVLVADNKFVADLTTNTRCLQEINSLMRLICEAASAEACCARLEDNVLRFSFTLTNNFRGRSIHHKDGCTIPYILGAHKYFQGNRTLALNPIALGLTNYCVSLDDKPNLKGTQQDHMAFNSLEQIRDKLLTYELETLLACLQRYDSFKAQGVFTTSVTGSKVALTDSRLIGFKIATSINDKGIVIRVNEQKSTDNCQWIVEQLATFLNLPKDKFAIIQNQIIIKQSVSELLTILAARRINYVGVITVSNETGDINLALRKNTNEEKDLGYSTEGGHNAFPYASILGVIKQLVEFGHVLRIKDAWTSWERIHHSDDCELWLINNSTIQLTKNSAQYARQNNRPFWVDSFEFMRRTECSLSLYQIRNRQMLLRNVPCFVPYLQFEQNRINQEIQNKCDAFRVTISDNHTVEAGKMRLHEDFGTIYIAIDSSLAIRENLKTLKEFFIKHLGSKCIMQELHDGIIILNINPLAFYSMVTKLDKSQLVALQKELEDGVKLAKENFWLQLV